MNITNKIDLTLKNISRSLKMVQDKLPPNPNDYEDIDDWSTDYNHWQKQPRGIILRVVSYSFWLILTGIVLYFIMK